MKTYVIFNLSERVFNKLYSSDFWKSIIKMYIFDKRHLQHLSEITRTV